MYMKNSHVVPSFDGAFPELSRFFDSLVRDYHAGNIAGWDDLERKTFLFFTGAMMASVDRKLPGWKKMSYYENGVTLVHVMCVFLGLLMLPEYAALSPEKQQIAKWTVLFHDIAKQPRQNYRDYLHGFRSAVVAAQSLPRFGFATTDAYEARIASWSELTDHAGIKPEGIKYPIQDNSKLPEIIKGIDEMFGENAPAALIVKGVLLHMSINVVKDWPQAAPLTNDEIRQYLDAEFLSLLQVMYLSDNEGWTMFDHELRQVQRDDTLQVYAEIKKACSL